MQTIKPILSILGVTALLLGTIVPNASYFGATAAFADSGKGGGNGNGGGGNGNGGGNTHSDNSGGKSSKAAEVASAEGESSGKSSHGLLASELKGLNAAHANPNALANANPSSQVGRLATYRDAAIAATEAQGAIDAADAALTVFDEANQGRSVTDIDADIAALDPTAEGYDPAQLDALNAELAAAQTRDIDRAVLADAVAAAETALATAGATEADALLAASKGRELSPEAIAYIRDLLNI